MIGLIRAELLKARRRQATWVLLILSLAVTGVIYFLIGRSIGGLSCSLDFGDFGDTGLGSCIVEFPAAYALIDQFAFATLGGLMAIVYAAAFVGAEWNWGVLRNVIARGEGRSRYLLAKAAALAIILGVGVFIIFLFALAMTYVIAFVNNVPISSPLRGNGLVDLLVNLALGYSVVLERAALGFAVAVVLRSQLAGAVVGIVLYLGEGIITTFLTVTSVAGSISGGFDPGSSGSSGLPVVGPEWFQYLPMSIGNQVLNATPGVSSGVGTGGLEGLFLRSVPIEQALPGLIIYLLVAMAISILVVNRREIA